jgi:hypothetical protein
MQELLDAWTGEAHPTEAMVPIAAPHLDDTAEGEAPAAVVAKPAPEQAPPALVGNRNILMHPPSGRRRLQDDDWWMSMPMVMRLPPVAAPQPLAPDGFTVA